MSRSPKVAYVNENAELTESAKKLVLSMTGRQADVERIPELAGPNEVYQILMDYGQWFLYAQILFKLIDMEIGKTIQKRIGEDIYAFIKSKLKTSESTSDDQRKLDDLMDFIEKANEAGFAVILGYDAKGFHYRNVGVKVRAGELEDVVVAVIALGAPEQDVTEILGQLVSSPGYLLLDEMNSDCSAVFNVYEGGIYIESNKGRIVLGADGRWQIEQRKKPENG